MLTPGRLLQPLRRRTSTGTRTSSCPTNGSAAAPARRAARPPGRAPALTSTQAIGSARVDRVVDISNNDTIESRYASSPAARSVVRPRAPRCARPGGAGRARDRAARRSARSPRLAASARAAGRPRAPRRAARRAGPAPPRGSAAGCGGWTRSPAGRRRRRCGGPAARGCARARRAPSGRSSTFTRSSTRVALRLTCCPPGPPPVVARSRTRAAGTIAPLARTRSSPSMRRNVPANARGAGRARRPAPRSFALARLAASGSRISR